MSESTSPRTRWSELAAGIGGAAGYQQRFDALAATGKDVHGEAAHVASMVRPPARVLDAGCGTGRVSAELTRLGYRCVGVDADRDMIEVAKGRDTATHYLHGDLSDLYLRGQVFDLVLMAGNVIPLLAPGTLDDVMSRITAHTVAGGYVVAGFGLDAAHLPDRCPVTELETYERAAMVHGLAPVHRFATWDREPWSARAGYVVSVHRRPQ